MRFLLRLLLLLGVLGGVAAVTAKPLQERWEERNRPEFKTGKVTRGDVISYVTATGKIKPVETIKIGSFVSGPIQDMPEEIDFNREVKKGDLMARVDPRLIDAQLKSAEASLAIRQAEVSRTQAQLQLAKNDEERAKKLQSKRKDYVPQAEMDRLRFAREQLEAGLKVAKASVKQAEAQLVTAKVNVGYTEIKAPKDGIIIDRKIEPGQTLAAQFQTPELFEIGVGMREQMHIYATVDETDIGRIRIAQADRQPVTFTVSAYPDEVFDGEIEQIRMSATDTQGVVTYPVIVTTKNPDLRLLPNMTADLSFKVEQHTDVLRIPNQAIRYIPDKKLVRKEDHKILDGSNWAKPDPEGWDDDDDDEADKEPEVSAQNRAKANRKRNLRHVWVVDGKLLKAVEVETGLADQDEGKTTEIVSGELTEDMEVVIGVEKKKGGFFGG